MFSGAGIQDFENLEDFEHLADLEDLEDLEDFADFVIPGFSGSSRVLTR